jgi:hypothetical protein
MDTHFYSKQHLELTPFLLQSARTTSALELKWHQLQHQMEATVSHGFQRPIRQYSRRFLPSQLAGFNVMEKITGKTQQVLDGLM